MIKTPKGFFCSINHAIEYADSINKKRRKQVRAAQRKKINGSDRALQTKLAQQAVNAFVRLRDKDKPCISCGRHHGGQYHAGHYRSVGSAPHLRFNTRQIHKQCQPCNMHLSGNIINYRRSLVDKFGQEYVEQIESDSKVRKFSIDDIKSIKEYYRKMVKRMKKATD
jgi:hypothetical protein